MRKHDEDFTVNWEADDGYCGASRPHSFNISPDDIEPDMDDEALERVLEDALESDFREKVNPYAKNRDEFIAWAHGVAAKKVDEE